MALKRGTIVKSPVSQKSYRIEEVLGEGGFGTAYRAWELNRKNKPFEEVVIKTTTDQASWHRESYFGEILRKSKRVIQTLDSFPLVPKRGGRLAFALVLELAEHGTVADWLEARERKPLPEARARREIGALLKVLDQLHGGSATHRDLTPMNVFACGRGCTLKLGDFGIARHDLAGARLTVDAFNPAFVTRGLASDERRYWDPSDDVYQMGILLATLLHGDPDHIPCAAESKDLACSRELKRIVERALGPKKQRYPDAFAMLRALEGDEEPEKSNLRSLSGRTVVFTGPLSLKRFDAELLVLQAGGQVGKSISKTTDVVVQGGRSKLYKSGHKGTKLSAVQKLIKKGQRIAVIGEAEFRRLTRADP